MLTPNMEEKENITCQKPEQSVFTPASADAARLARLPAWDAAVFAQEMPAVEHAGLKKDLLAFQLSSRVTKPTKSSSAMVDAERLVSLLQMKCLNESSMKS